MLVVSILKTKFGLMRKYFQVRSSRPEVVRKKDVLRNFTKITGKHLSQSLFFNKVAGARPTTLLKMKLWHRCFPVNFVKFLRRPFFIEHFWWLLPSSAHHVISVYLCTEISYEEKFAEKIHKNGQNVLSSKTLTQ